MYLTTTHLCLVLVYLTPSVLSSPAPASSDDHPQFHSDRTPAYLQSPSPSAFFPQLKRLRDTAFGFLGKYPGIKSCSKDEHRHKGNGRDGLPTRLLAKYGRDVVLRFNISSSEEEEALAKAADSLFLDVWQFTNNWADIRLGRDDVCSAILCPVCLGCG